MEVVLGDGQTARPAGFCERSKARLLDVLVVCAGVSGSLAAVAFTAGFLRALLAPGSPSGVGDIAYLRWIVLAIYVLSAAVLMHEPAVTARRGQTIGKRRAGIKVVRYCDAQTPGAVRALVRWAAPSALGVFAAVRFARTVVPEGEWLRVWGHTSTSTLLSLAAGLALWLAVYLSSLLDSNGRGWHDKAAGTIVIKTPIKTPRPDHAAPPGPGDEPPRGGNVGPGTGVCTRGETTARCEDESGPRVRETGCAGPLPAAGGSGWMAVRAVGLLAVAVVAVACGGGQARTVNGDSGASGGQEVVRSELGSPDGGVGDGSGAGYRREPVGSQPSSVGDGLGGDPGAGGGLGAQGSGLGMFEAEVLTVGVGQSCALGSNREAEGLVACWGVLRPGQPAVLEGSDVDVSAGGTLTCALETAGGVACWSDYGSGRVEAPSGAFVDVSAGGDHACALAVDGAVTCWGDNTSGQADAPEGDYSAVSAGGSHSCALDAAGAVVCWGEGEGAVGEPTVGSYAAVSAGQRHSCAVAVDGAVVCWGDRDTPVPHFVRWVDHRDAG